MTTVSLESQEFQLNRTNGDDAITKTKKNNYTLVIFHLSFFFCLFESLLNHIDCALHSLRE